MDRKVETNLSAEAHLLVREGDVAYNMMRMWQGVLGRAEYDCLVSPAYVVVSPSERIESHFGLNLLSTPAAIAWYKRRSYGVVDDRLRLYPSDLLRIPVALPSSLAEQLAITEQIRVIDESLHGQSASLNKLRQQRQGLMQDLLTGGVRVAALGS
jgi:type I restriction enzyme S subunit